MNIRISGFLALATMALSGCVAHTWAPGPTASEPFTVASGKCKLVAMGADKSGFAFGSPGFVAGASIGRGIGNAVRENRAYNACMEAMGFVAVDTQPRPRTASMSAPAK